MKKLLAVLLGLTMVLVVWGGSGQASSDAPGELDFSAMVDIEPSDLELTPQLDAVLAEAVMAKVVRFDSDQVDDWMSSDALEVSLPNGDVITVGREAREPAAAGAEVWTGQNATGEAVTISRMNGIVTVAVQVHEGQYTISPIADDQYLMYMDGRAAAAASRSKSTSRTVNG